MGEIDIQIVITAITIIFSGGVAGIIKTYTDARLKHVATEARIDRQNVQLCQDLNKDLQTRINSLERMLHEQAIQTQNILSKRREEDKEYLFQIAELRTKNAVLENRIKQLESEIKTLKNGYENNEIDKPQSE